MYGTIAVTAVDVIDLHLGGLGCTHSSTRVLTKGRNPEFRRNPCTYSIHSASILISGVGVTGGCDSRARGIPVLVGWSNARYPNISVQQLSPPLEADGEGEGLTASTTMSQGGLLSIPPITSGVRKIKDNRKLSNNRNQLLVRFSRDAAESFVRYPLGTRIRPPSHKRGVLVSVLLIHRTSDPWRRRF